MAAPPFVRALLLLLWAAALAPLASFAPASATAIRRMPAPPASVYTYDGVIYDRAFSVLFPPRTMAQVVRRVADPRVRLLAGTPYAITSLAAVYKGSFGPLNGGFPTAVNNSGLIAFYDECGCFTGTDFYNADAGLIIDDKGNDHAALYWCCFDQGFANAIPYAINSAGETAGDYSQYNNGGPPEFTGYIAWSANGGFLYNDYLGSGYFDSSFADAINDAGVSVGQSQSARNGDIAQLYSQNGPLKLLPPKNTSWVGTATGINKSGTIVGYGIFPKQSVGRALRFFQNGYAVVIPVGAPGVSTSAQAINVHGDIVGNAGSQAFLYKNNRVTYLPRPPGESAGNAVAYAVNASDEVVGDIVTSTGQTAFLYVNGKSYDLTSLLSSNPGWQMTHATGINDFGQIVGYGNFGSFSMKPQSPATATSVKRF
jgi:hypothetical protein